MRLCISGSREYKALGKVTSFINKLDQDVEVIVGDARGVDFEVYQECVTRGMKVNVYKPDWEGLGLPAGPIRNKQMVSDSDVVVAFWDGKSRGTKSTIDIARRFGKLLAVIPE